MVRRKTNYKGEKSLLMWDGRLTVSAAVAKRLTGRVCRPGYDRRVQGCKDWVAHTAYNGKPYFYIIQSVSN